MRPFGSGVAGSRTFFHFRGHGASTAPQTPWNYAALARRAEGGRRPRRGDAGPRGEHGCRCSVQSVGGRPLRFERLVFVMPAVLDRLRTDGALDRLVEMAKCADDRDVEGMTVLLLEGEACQRAGQPAVQLWCRRQAAVLVGTQISSALRALPIAVPLPGRAVLASGHRAGAGHCPGAGPCPPGMDCRAARRLAAERSLEVMAPGGLLWRHRALMRELIGDFCPENLVNGPPDQARPSGSMRLKGEIPGAPLRWD